MKTITVRDLRNDYLQVMGWIDQGEEVQITRKGKVFARLSPEAEALERVDWEESAVLQMDRKGVRRLTVKEASDILTASRGEE